MRRAVIVVLVIVGTLVLIRIGLEVSFSDVPDRETIRQAFKEDVRELQREEQSQSAPSLSADTLRCIDVRSLRYEIGVYAQPPVPPGEPIEVDDWVRLYSCLADEEAEAIPRKAEWPPSYQRCVEDEIGQDAFIRYWLYATEEDDTPLVIVECFVSTGWTPLWLDE